MNYNYIVNPLTNRKCSIYSRNGQNILKTYINQDGGACDLCGAEGVTKQHVHIILTQKILNELNTTKN